MILVEEIDTEFGTIKIMREKKSGIVTYYQNSCFHSQATAEGVSTCVYVHVMHKAIKQSGAKSILMIGCAGGTLATMLQREGCNVTVVDINPHAFSIAKHYFQLPEEVECITADGIAFLAKNTKTYDAIAIDAFDSEGAIPDDFKQEDFLQSAKNALSEKGLLVMNVMTLHDLDFESDRIALALEEFGMPTALYDWPGQRNRNTLVLAGAVKNIRIPTGKEPNFITREMKGLVRRKAKKHAGQWVG